MLFRSVLSGTTLSSGWIQTAELNTVDDQVIGIELVDATRLVLVGNRFDVAVAQKSDGLFPRNPDNTPGTPVLSGYINASAKCIKKDSANKILVGGNSSNQMALMKFDPTNIALPGSPTTFTGNGSVSAITFDASEKILLAGTSGTGLGIRRLNTNLTLDTNFGSSGLISDTVATEAKDVVVDSAGQILIVGTASDNMLIKRYQPGSNGNFTPPTTSEIGRAHVWTPVT